MAATSQAARSLSPSSVEATKIKRNLVANYLGTAFVAASQIVIIPLYLRYLGEHDWGLLSSLLALAATLLILEAGVSQAVARGISERNADSPRIDRRAFQIVERRYLVMTLSASALLALVSGRLGPLLLPHAGVDARGFALLAIAMAASQIVGSLYRGTLVGHGAQVRLNVLVIAVTIARHTIGVTLAARGYGVIPVALALAGSLVAEAALRRWLVSRLLSTRTGTGYANARERNPLVARGALVLAFAGMIGALATQLDRLILGTSISAVDLGRYAIAATLSLSVLQLIYPISNALMPHLKDFQDSGAGRGLLSRTYRMLFAILLLLWVGAAFIAAKGMQWWLPHVESADVASVVAPLFLIHLIGTSLNALCVPLYLTLLARHLDRHIFVANLCSICVLVVTLTTLIPRYGATAGSLAWLFANGTLLMFYFSIYRSRTGHHD